MKWEKEWDAQRLANAELPTDPQEAPEPVGLWKAGHWAQKVARWVTDTGVAVRARLPFISGLADKSPPVAKQLLSGSAQLSLAGLLIIEVLLLLQLHIQP